jgi:hypothetical protein
MVAPELVFAVLNAARAAGDRGLELLRWHRVILGLPDLDWTHSEAYRQGVAELDDAHAAELLTDLRRAVRDSGRHRHGADGKPLHRGGQTLRQKYRHT